MITAKHRKIWCTSCTKKNLITAPHKYPTLLLPDSRAAAQLRSSFVTVCLHISKVLSSLSRQWAALKWSCRLFGAHLFSHETVLSLERVRKYIQRRRRVNEYIYVYVSISINKLSLHWSINEWVTLSVTHSCFHLHSTTGSCDSDRIILSSAWRRILVRTYETQSGTSFFYWDIKAALSRRSHVQASITPRKSERQRLVLIFWCCRLLLNRASSALFALSQGSWSKCVRRENRGRWCVCGGGLILHTSCMLW